MNSKIIWLHHKQKYSILNEVEITKSGIEIDYEAWKRKQGNTIYNQEKNQPIKTSSEMTLMLELIEKTVIICI